MYYGGTEMIVREFTKSNVPTYRYMYSHKGTFTLTDVFLLSKTTFAAKMFIEYLTGWKLVDLDMGVCHSDELFVIFNPHSIPMNSLVSSEDKKASQRILSYFVNFATHGKWEKCAIIFNLTWNYQTLKSLLRLQIPS